MLPRTVHPALPTRLAALAATAALTCAAPPIAAAPDAGAGELTEERFLELHRQLQPSPDEAWRTIPWKIRLLDAQREAAREGKPIFIWAMDGHPLGCT